MEGDDRSRMTVVGGWRVVVLKLILLFALCPGRESESPNFTTCRYAALGLKRP